MVRCFTFVFAVSVFWGIPPRVVTVAAQEPGLGKVALCSVEKEPSKFDGDLISVRARVQSDGTHGAQIYDELCGTFGVSLDVPDDAVGRDELLSALGRGVRGTRDKIIYGTFTGRFELSSKNPSQRTLKIVRIEDVKVRMKKG